MQEGRWGGHTQQSRSVAQPPNFKRLLIPNRPSELLPSSHTMSRWRRFTHRDAVSTVCPLAAGVSDRPGNKGSVSVIVWSPSHQQAGQWTSAWLSCQVLAGPLAHAPQYREERMGRGSSGKLSHCCMFHAVHDAQHLRVLDVGQPDTCRHICRYFLNLSVEPHVRSWGR